MNIVIFIGTTDYFTSFYFELLILVPVAVISRVFRGSDYCWRAGSGPGELTRSGPTRPDPSRDI